MQELAQLASNEEMISGGGGVDSQCPGGRAAVVGEQAGRIARVNGAYWTEMQRKDLIRLSTNRGQCSHSTDRLRLSSA